LPVRCQLNLGGSHAGLSPGDIFRTRSPPSKATGGPAPLRIRFSQSERRLRGIDIRLWNETLLRQGLATLEGPSRVHDLGFRSGDRGLLLLNILAARRGSRLTRRRRVSSRDASERSTARRF
jgi:hypothetical protein